MRTIAIINQKGGCGKTTCSINLAAVLALRGRKTLLVDMDPQGHCALGLAVPDSQITMDISDLLRAGLDGSLSLSDVIWQVSRNLDLVPSSMSLAAMEQELAPMPDRDRRLSQILNTIEDDYEFCIIDCPPSIGLLTFNALRAAGEIITPVETGYFALQGSFKQEATIQMLARRANHHAKFHVMATMYDVRTKLAREILLELKKHFGDHLMPVVVHFNSKLKEAASFGQPITEYDPGSRGFQDFDKLASWLIANPTIPPDFGNNGQPGNNANSPAMSRAAELVERARALTARTQALASRINDKNTQTPNAPSYIPPIVTPSRTSPTPHTTHTAPASTPATRIAPVSSADAPTVITRPVMPAPHTHPAPGHSPAHAAIQAMTTAIAEPITRQTTQHTVQIDAPPPSHTPPPTAPPPSRVAHLFGVRTTQQGLLFVQPITLGDKVEIAGDFNNWKPHTTPMRRDARSGVWQLCVPVKPGHHHYRLIVNGQWIEDPHNPHVEANPFGELNNVIDIPDPDSTTT